MAPVMAAGIVTIRTIHGWGSRSAPPADDAQAQVLWNALAPELWVVDDHRHPACPGSAGWPPGGPPCGGWSALLYAKVAEFQRRGAIQFHAVIRLDAATECRCPGCLAPPPEPFTATLLEDALLGKLSRPSGCPARPWTMAGRTAMPAGASSSTSATSPSDSDQAGELSAEQVAGYIAKYATKATESFGAGLDRRLHRRRRPGAPRRAAGACGRARPGLLGAGRPPGARQGCGCGRGRTCSGFGGHWSTKSRRYSTTFTVLRRARVAFAKRRRARDGVPLDAWGRPEDDQAVIVVASWVYVGSGYETEGERWLAASAAARAREERRIAKEELRTTSGGGHEKYQGAGDRRMDRLLTWDEAAERLNTTPAAWCVGWWFERRIAYRQARPLCSLPILMTWRSTSLRTGWRSSVALRGPDRLWSCGVGRS